MPLVSFEWQAAGRGDRGLLLLSVDDSGDGPRVIGCVASRPDAAAIAVDTRDLVEAKALLEDLG